MNEEVKNLNFGTEDVNEESKKHEEEVKKLMDELKENEVFKNMSFGSGNDGNWILILLLFLIFAFPFGSNDSMHYDKQTIAYQKGKIEAYEKILRGE